MLQHLTKRVLFAIEGMFWLLTPIYAQQPQLDAIDQVQLDLIELFTPFTWRQSNVGSAGTTLHYRVFMPHNQRSEQQFPLIVWLHGYGEAGGNNTSQLRWLELMFPDRDAAESAQFYVLATQCPAEHPMWFEHFASATEEANIEDDPLDQLRAIIDETIKHFPIDADRIVIAGVSSGASGCFEMAMRHPTLFAAVVPLGPGRADGSRIESLRDVPVWAFISADDGEDTAFIIGEAFRQLTKAGGSGLLTITEDATHDCWTTAFQDYDISAWMLSQKKGQETSRPPGHVRWQVQLKSVLLLLTRRQTIQFAVLAGCVSLSLIAVRKERKRRASSKASAMAD